MTSSDTATPERIAGGPDVAPRSDQHLLVMRGVSKHFGDTQALIEADLDVSAGEIVALLGENGAGKSTLIKVLAGIHALDAGSVRYRDRDVTSGLRRLPIAFIHQDLGLIDWMTVAENISLMLGFPRRFGLIDWGAARARAAWRGVSGVWLWFSQFYEDAASTPVLQEFRRFVEELSQHVSVFNMHGSYLSLALSRFGMSGISHGVGYGEQKDVIPVIGQSTPTVRYYLPDLKRRLGVPQIERAFSNVGVKSADDFFDKICGCVICRGVLGDSLGGFSSFGDLHYSTVESRRMAQTPAAAKQCRFHFLLNRARERDELGDLAPTAISRRFQSAYEKWKDQPTISGDVAHLPRWKRVFED